MIETMWLLLFLVIFVEAITEIFVSSSIFTSFREFVGQRSAFLGELVHCGYCTSVWVSASVAWTLSAVGTNYLWLDYIICVFVLHRLSNLFHELTCKWMNRLPLTIAMHKTESVILTETEDGNISEANKKAG